MRSTGYVGRVGIHEILTVDDEVRAAMGGPASAIQVAAVKGGQTTLLYEQAARLCEAGGTTVDESCACSASPTESTLLAQSGRVRSTYSSTSRNPSRR